MKLRRISVVVMAITAVLAAERAMVGQQAPQASRPQNQAGVLSQQLVERALSSGRVRVIVGLDVPVQPEGVLTAAERAAQRAAIIDAQATVLDALAGVNLGQVKRFSIVPGMALEADLATLDFLAAHPRVAYIEEDRPEPAHLAESAVIIGAPTVWGAGFTGAGQTVAVLDTGVDRNHPFFGSRVVSEACYSTTADLGGGSTSTAICSPYGSTSTGAAAPCAGMCDHGTHVAGIAAGSGTLGGTAMHGVARGANIIAVQVFSQFSGPVCGGTSPCVLSYVSDQVAGLERVYALRSTFTIAAANMSLGGGQFFDQATCDGQNASRKPVIDNLRAAGIATVISSGNNGFKTSMSAPACISSAISVASTNDGSTFAGQPATPTDSISSFSNVASFLTLFAPGRWITSSIPVASGSVDTYQGTSMAAPQVTGAFALLKSRFPSATLQQVLDALTSTGLSVTDTRAGAPGTITKRRINVADASGTLAPCGAGTLSASSASVPSAATSGLTVGVTIGASCGWTAVSNAGFISITGGASGTGNGTVTYAVAVNSTTVPRTGTMTIAGQTFTVRQNASTVYERMVVGTGAFGSEGGWVGVRAGADASFNANAWQRLPWPTYNGTGKGVHPALGDVDGDGLDELALGVESGGNGWIAVLDDAAHGFALLQWVQVPWPTYNAANGEVWPAIGDIDNDGKAELVGGLGTGGAGWFIIFDDASAGFAPVAWRQTAWSAYNAGSSGVTRPAIGNVTGSGGAEIVIGLGPGSAGWVEVFGDATTGYSHQAWFQLGWGAYNTANGETFPAAGDLDGDGRAEIVLGLGPGGAGWFQIVDDASTTYAAITWRQVTWAAYAADASRGSTYPAVGDVTGDGLADIVIGLENFPGEGGWFEIRSSSAGSYGSIGWRNLDWAAYRAAGGATRPAAGRLR